MSGKSSHPPFFNRNMIQGRAAHVLREFQRKSNKRLEFPIDVDLVGELVFDLKWDWDVLPEGSNDRVLAALYCSERRAVLNETHKDLFDSKPRMERFTCAHEIGHADLHADLSDLEGDPSQESVIFHRDISGYSEEEINAHYWRERHADWYAASLMMPSDVFLRKVREHPVEAPADAQRYATFFGVSYTALNLRLRDHGMRYFDRHGRLCIPRGRDRNQQELFEM